jgi:hypothetical protein
MLLLSIGAFALLLIIFLFFRCESISRQYKSLRIQFTSTDKSNKYLVKQMAMMAEEIQYNYLIQLDGAEKRGIVDAGVARKIKALVHCISGVVEADLKGETMQQALTSKLPAHEITMEEIQKMIMEQEGPVRMAWSKNTLDGYMRLCRELMAKAQGHKSGAH